MFEDVVTVFNRREDMWYPSVIRGVQVQAERAAEPGKYGGKRADRVTVLVPYVPMEGAAVIGGKTYLPPRSWKREEEPEKYVTFAAGEKFDFFFLGAWEGTEPIRDEDWPEGFYGRMDRERDGVYAIASAARFGTLPHFEIVGR